jgi:hypothetical protein
VEFIANNPGDWMLHCHIPHHMMNHMVPMVGPDMDAHLAAADQKQHQDHEHPDGKADKAKPKGEHPQGHDEKNGAKPHEGHQHGKGAQGADAKSGSAQPHAGQSAHAKADNPWRIPGYPQDMMDMPSMFSEDQLERINGPRTRGMRLEWHRGAMGMVTFLRVLPEAEYTKVMAKT